jgi:hypothetical protein
MRSGKNVQLDFTNQPGPVRRAYFSPSKSIVMSKYNHQEFGAIADARNAVKPIEIKPVAFVKRGRDMHDGKPLYAMQFFLFGELVETKGPGAKREDYINVCGITDFEFDLLIA